MTYIGLGRRFVAWLIDSLIVSLAWVPFAETESGNGSYSVRWEGMDAVWPVLISLAYLIVLEGSFGATVGKVVVGIRVRREDGSRIGFGPAAIRNVARLVDGLPYVIPYLTGAIALSRSSTKQRLGDRWAGTVVVLVGTEDRATEHRATELGAPGGSAAAAAIPGDRTADRPTGLPSPPPGSPPSPEPRGSLPPPPPSSP